MISHISFRLYDSHTWGCRVSQSGNKTKTPRPNKTYRDDRTEIRSVSLSLAMIDKTDKQTYNRTDRSKSEEKGGSCTDEP